MWGTSAPTSAVFFPFRFSSAYIYIEREAVAATGGDLLNKFTVPARAQARPSELAGIAWFGLLYIDKLAVLSGLASSTSNWPVLDFSSSPGAPCGALFWAFDLTAHQLAVLCASMTALSSQLVKGYSFAPRQLGRIGFLCVVMPNIRADCEQKPPNCSPLDEKLYMELW
jgi:hypothetical protein